MAVKFTSEQLSEIFDADRHLKLSEAMYAKIVANANRQYIVSSLYPRIWRTISEYKNATPLGHVVNPKIGPAIIRYPGEDTPRTVDGAFSVNKDTNGRQVWNTFNNAQLTSLTPYVNFYSKFTDNTGANITYESIPLQNVHPSIKVKNHADYAMGRSNAIFGFLGLKSIDIELAGKYEETKYSDIKVDVVFAGNTLHLLDNETYLPLIMPHYEKNNMMGHQLMLEYGYNDPSAQTIKNLKFSKSQVKELKRQRMTYALYYYKHDLNIEQDGSFTLTVGYIARATQELKNVDLGMPAGSDFTKLYGSDPFPNKGVTKIPDLDAKIYKYIEDTHPGADEAQRSIIKNYFYQSPSTADQLFENRKQQIQQDAVSKIKTIPATLRSKGLEFLITLPHIKKRAHYLRCAVIASHLDMMAHSDPHPLELGGAAYTFPDFYKNVTGVLAMDSPTKKVVSKHDFYQTATVANNEDTNSQLQGTNIFRNLNDTSIPLLAAQTAEQKKYTGGFFAVTKTAKEYLAAGMIDTKASHAPRFATAFKPSTTEGRAEDAFYYEHAYFYRFGDLLEAFLTVTSGRQTFADQGVSIFLGTCRVKSRFNTTMFDGYFNHRDQQTGNFPLYDVAIEKNEFINMINDNYINRSASRITFQSFMDNLMNIVRKYYLVGDPITQPKVNHPANAVSMNMYSVPRSVAERFSKDKNLSLRKIETTDFRKPVGGTKAKGSTITPAETGNIFVINVGNTGPSPQLAGVNEEKYDTYYIGDIHTVVKRAKYTRVQTATQKAIESDNVAAVAKDEEGGIIPHLYNIDMDMIGNVRFTPGYYFNVKPFAPKIAGNRKNPPYASGGILKRLGLDCLNIAITVNHKLDQNGFNTTLKSMAILKNN